MAIKSKNVSKKIVSGGVNSLSTTKKLPIYSSNLKEMIESNCIYVDKTQYIYGLVRDKGLYFLSRPRRFGKSLLISTLEEIFSGNKKLFENLWLGSSDYDWKEYPVIRLDFSQIKHTTAEELTISLLWQLKIIAQTYSINVDQAPNVDATLQLLIIELSKKNPVVILIDEYDKPILDHLENLEEAEKQRAVLASFYATIKSLDKYLRFVFLTGVTRFAKTSLFSGINNLNDISLKPEAAVLVGCTQEEIIHYFTPYLNDFAQQQSKSVQELLDKLRKWYNGYQFAKEGTKVYNPFSLLYCLHDKEFRNYWYQSGNPHFLIKLLRNQYLTLESVQDIELSEASLSNFDIDAIPVVPLLFQTGYLTMTHYDQETRKFKLAFPNFEIEESFTTFLVASMTFASGGIIESSLDRLKAAILRNDLEKFFYELRLVFANIPHRILREDYYHTTFQFVLSVLLLESHSEVMTNKGQIDLVLTTKTHSYIFELKVNKSAAIALKQIHDRAYYERYLNKGKIVVLVGLSFNRDEKSLEIEHQEEIL